MRPVLQFHQVVKRYGKRRALDGLTLSVRPGIIMGLVGSNGAGKSTALSAAAGLLHTQGGTIDLLGEGPFQADRHAGRVSLLPQDSRMPPHLKLTDALTYYARLQGRTSRQAATQIETLLDDLHLGDRADSRIRTLSHGMNRRLTIAQAFLGQPELVLLDEPMNGLDPAEVTRARRFLDARRGHQTIVISSHLLGELETLCDEVAFIEQGACLRQDSIANLTSRNGQVTFHLEGQPLPLDAMADALPDATFLPTFDNQKLVVRFHETVLTVPDVIARLVPLLTEAGVGVCEIRRGDALETTFLEQRDAAS